MFPLGEAVPVHMPKCLGNNLFDCSQGVSLAHLIHLLLQFFFHTQLNLANMPSDLSAQLR